MCIFRFITIVQSNIFYISCSHFQPNTDYIPYRNPRKLSSPHLKNTLHSCHILYTVINFSMSDTLQFGISHINVSFSSENTVATDYITYMCTKRNTWYIALRCKVSIILLLGSWNTVKISRIMHMWRHPTSFAVIRNEGFWIMDVCRFEEHRSSFHWILLVMTVCTVCIRIVGMSSTC